MKYSIKNFLYDTSKFRVSCMTFMFFISITYINLFAVILSSLCGIWGLSLFFVKGISLKKLKKIKFFKLICLFMISNLITLIINIKHNFWINLGYFLYAILCFTLFYGMSEYDEEKEIKKEIIIFFNRIVLITTILGALSILTMFIPFELPKDFFNFVPGVYKSERLTGIYVNPNLLGFASSVSLIMTFSIFNRKKNTNEKNRLNPYFTLVSVIINVVCLLLCDSNASILFLIVYMVIFVFCKLCLMIDGVNFFNMIRNTVVLIISGILLIVAYLCMRQACQDIINKTIIENHLSQGEIDNNSQLELNEQIVRFGRKLGEGNYKDISSGRIDLFKQGIKIFLRHPILGIGRGNLIYYGEKYLDNGLRFEDLHNGYLTILVSSGIIGFIIFLIFGILVFKDLFSILFKKGMSNKIDPMYIHIISAISSYCIYSFFEKTIFSEPTFMTIIFWAWLGYGMTYIKKIEY